MPPAHSLPLRPRSTTDIDALIERVSPAIVRLLADGVPRSKATIVAALAGAYPKPEVVQALMRLVVTGWLSETRRKFHLPSPDTAEE